MCRAIVSCAAALNRSRVRFRVPLRPRELSGKGLEHGFVALSARLSRSVYGPIVSENAVIQAQWQGHLRYIPK
jgi:hypothetical protein